MPWHFFRSAPGRGFTLIELLVVIAIIGLLSSIVLASLNSARVKSRDARRLEDLKQMANAVQLYDVDPAPNFAPNGCKGGVKVSTCTSPNFANYADPVTGNTACKGSRALGGASNAQCDYSVETATGGVNALPTSQNWAVCAWIEGSVGSLTGPALIHVGSDTSGSPVAGCP
jgi:prepilin-type N-terminal cleavage/methylation domain-containing protein